MRSLAITLALSAGVALVAGCPETRHATSIPSPSGTNRINAGTIPDLVFAIIGDTRPPAIDDTAAYPTPVIATIFQDIENATPRPAFGISTGDYMYASNSGGQPGPQLDLYLAARSNFTNPVYPAMGNHECTGFTDSNCGAGTSDGETNQYLTYLSKFLAPLGVTSPWYSVRIAADDGSWTAKLVFIAANSWSSDQQAWLDAELSDPTTYTFVVRHEPGDATTAPGVTPSANIISAHPLTMLIEGHTHTYYHGATTREIVVGNGGAPITSSVKYGYVIVSRRANGDVQFDEHDYDTGVIEDSFAVHPDGTAAN